MGGDKISNKNRNSRGTIHNDFYSGDIADDRISDIYNEVDSRDQNWDLRDFKIDPVAAKLINQYQNEKPNEKPNKEGKNMAEVKKTLNQQYDKENPLGDPMADPNFREALRWVSEGIYEPPEFDIEWQNGECFAHWTFRPRKDFKEFHFHEEKQ